MQRSGDVPLSLAGHRQHHRIRWQPRGQGRDERSNVLLDSAANVCFGEHGNCDWQDLGKVQLVQRVHPAILAQADDIIQEQSLAEFDKRLAVSTFLSETGT